MQGMGSGRASTVNRGRMITSNIADCINVCLVEALQLSILEFSKEFRILFGLVIAKTEK